MYNINIWYILNIKTWHNYVMRNLTSRPVSLKEWEILKHVSRRPWGKSRSGWGRRSSIQFWAYNSGGRLTEMTYIQQYRFWEMQPIVSLYFISDTVTSIWEKGLHMSKDDNSEFVQICVGLLFQEVFLEVFLTEQTDSLHPNPFEPVGLMGKCPTSGCLY